MITVGICDDEQRVRRELRKCCEDYFTGKRLDYSILEYDSGESFLMGNNPDILLLDIKMHRISGLLVKEVLAKAHAKTRIIFLADNVNFMSDAFGRNVFGYLVKPVRREPFGRKMDDAIEDLMEYKKFTYCKYEGRIEQVYWSGIVCLESYGRYTKVYVQGVDGYMISDMGIRKWYEELPKLQYARTAKGLIVNLAYVARVDEQIEMINGAHVTLSRYCQAEFDERYKRWEVKHRKGV